MIEPPWAYKTEKVNPDYEHKELSDLSEGKYFSDRSNKKGKTKKAKECNKSFGQKTLWPDQAKKHSQI